jgi:hypothetical protein
VKPIRARMRTTTRTMNISEATGSGVRGQRKV